MADNKPFSDQEAIEILSMPKAIGEVIRWVSKKNGRPFERSFRATIVATGRPAFERELLLYGESYQSRTGFFPWSIGILVSGLRPNLVRFDAHLNPHSNLDGSVVKGCMMHQWSEEHSDRFAVSAKDFIDCSSVESALPDILGYCNIKHSQALQKKWEGEFYG